MGIISSVVGVAIETAWEALKGVGTGITNIAESMHLKEKSINAINSTKNWFSSVLIGDGNITLDEIKISIIAPTGFGKTTLISTLYEEIKKQTPSYMKVAVNGDADDKRLRDFSKKLNDAIAAKSLTQSAADFSDIKGTADTHKFSFDISIEGEVGKNKKVKIIQPFSIMDIPGGWVNPDNRTSDDAKNKWTEFEQKHLPASFLLWIPIDATLIGEAITSKDKSIASHYVDAKDIGDLAQKWAKNRKQGDGSMAFYIPLKCEHYLSQDIVKDGERKVREGHLRSCFKYYYEEVIKKINEQKTGVKQYYLPVETIGCIDLLNSNFNDNKFSAEFKIDGNTVRYRNADELVRSVYKAAINQIEHGDKNSYGTINKVSLLDKAKLKKKYNNLHKIMEPIRSEFERDSELKVAEEVYEAD